jgi:hypothetical protein
MRELRDIATSGGGVASRKRLTGLLVEMLALTIRCDACRRINSGEDA